MGVVKLPKKVRMVCYEIMDGQEGALDALETFADKYPHQVAAVKAEMGAVLTRLMPLTALWMMSLPR